jgi:hypothetical protein
MRRVDPGANVICVRLAGCSHLKLVQSRGAQTISIQARARPLASQDEEVTVLLDRSLDPQDSGGADKVVEVMDGELKDTSI